MIIGVPKEIMKGERRVAASPETVKKMVSDGLTVLIEKDAGEGAFYHDQEYLASGAEIVENVAELFDRADVILKVKEPLFNEQHDKHEVDLMHEGQVIITFIHPAAPANHDMVKHMAERGITSITLDGIPRITRAQAMDALTSMSTCAGYKGMLIAANELPNFVPQIFTAVGMIKPINVLVVGVGVGGLQAIATAKRLGAIVHAADIRPAAAEQAMSLGCKLLKFFPAGNAGGPAMLKAFAGPYGHTGVKFIPTGGISSANLAEYLKVPVVAAIGGSWMVDKQLVNDGKWDEITRLTREALEAAAAC